MILIVLGLLTFILLYLIIFSTIKLIGVIVRGIYIPLDIIRLLIIFFDRLTSGKAFGGLGLTLAFLGMLGEIYQVLVMFLS